MAGADRLLETYWSLAVFSQAFITLDYEPVKNPADNADWAPCRSLAVRGHGQF